VKVKPDPRFLGQGETERKGLGKGEKCRRTDPEKRACQLRLTKDFIASEGVLAWKSKKRRRVKERRQGGHQRIEECTIFREVDYLLPTNICSGGWGRTRNVGALRRKGGNQK